MIVGIWQQQNNLPSDPSQVHRMLKRAIFHSMEKLTFVPFKLDSLFKFISTRSLIVILSKK